MTRVRTEASRHYHHNRQEAIRSVIDKRISDLPVGTKIYTTPFAISLGKIRGHVVERTHIRWFLHDRDDLVYRRNHYVKVK